MSNLGLYQWMTTTSKKIGGPLPFMGALLGIGAAVTKTIDIVSERISAAREEKKKNEEAAIIHKVTCDGKSNEGLTFIDHGIPENPPHGFIVPCTLQLLVENAIKHNAFSASDPLVIEVTTDGKSISMENTLRPKAFTAPSTGIGLQYIRNQYRDLAGAEIQVVKTNTHFKVTLPILPYHNKLVTLSPDR